MDGWIIIAASTRIERALARHQSPCRRSAPPPACRDSARGRAVCRSASPAPSPRRSPAVAMMLWPQAWPMPGRASYSDRIATVGPPSLPNSAAYAVLRPKASRCVGDAVAFDGVAQPRRRLEFLQRQFGLAMDGMAQRQQFFAHRIDGSRATSFFRVSRTHGVARVRSAGIIDSPASLCEGRFGNESGTDGKVRAR